MSPLVDMLVRIVEIRPVEPEVADLTRQHPETPAGGQRDGDSQRRNRGEDRVNAHSATIKKIVAGIPGTTAPIKPRMTLQPPQASKA